MDHAGSLPQGLLDLTGLRPLLEHDGPVATVAMATPGAVEQAAERSGAAWSDLRSQLLARGAPEAALGAIDGVVPDAHRDGEGLLVVADEGGVLLAEHSPVPPRHTVARWDALPAVGTALDWRQHQPRYVVVLVDRTGADLISGGARLEGATEEVEGGSSHPVHDAAGAHHERTAVEGWERNAADVAADLEALVGRFRPTVVLAGGDPQALGLLREALGKEVRDRLVEIDGSRGADGGGDRTAVEVSRMVATAAATATVDVLEAWKQQAGSDGRAADGVEDVLAALRQSQVAALLVHDDPADDRRAVYADAPGLVALAAADLAGVGGDGEVTDGRLVDVALRAAAQTDAAVHLVPSAGGPAGGFGALLRW